ncbi:hypothetical protein COCNU_scaffold002192G000020 [Cocos nucifera]|nr:hypothetical protein [Cocos nucifera]
MRCYEDGCQRMRCDLILFGDHIYACGKLFVHLVRLQHDLCLKSWRLSNFQPSDAILSFFMENMVGRQPSESNLGPRPRNGVPTSSY